MGSYPDVSIPCEWCGEFGATGSPWYTSPELQLNFDVFLDGVFSNDVDGLGVLCDECVARGEPANSPNNRQRCALWLEKSVVLFSLFSAETYKVIADWLAPNVP